MPSWNLDFEAFEVPGSTQKLCRLDLEAHARRGGVSPQRLLRLGGRGLHVQDQCLGVLANDRLRYCHHIARAIIENRSVCLGDEDLETLLADNPKADTFIRQYSAFKPLFQTPYARSLHLDSATCQVQLSRLTIPIAITRTSFVRTSTQS